MNENVRAKDISDASNAPERRNVLLDGTFVRLEHRPGPKRPALVVFGDEKCGTDGFANAAGVDLYHVIPKGPHWYPASETGPMAETIARQLDGRPALALGASMGGYGALRYGARAGCTTVLAFSPQARLDPDMVRFGGRLARFHRSDLHGNMQVTPQHLPERAYVVIDPGDAHDLLHAELLRHEAGVEVITLPRMGHRTDRALSSPEIAAEVLDAATAGDRNRLARVLRRGQRTLPCYLARLSTACTGSGHPKWGAAIARLPLRAGGELVPELQLALARARMGLGQERAALASLEALVADDPGNCRYWQALAEQYATMGQSEAAAGVLEMALEQTEDFRFCRMLIRNRMELGEDRQALLLAEMAQEQWPDRAAQVERLKARIGQAGEAAERHGAPFGR